MTDYIRGTGRRKESVARVMLKKGTGKIVVNNKEFEKYFQTINSQNEVLKPLYATNTNNKYDIYVRVNGGGITGQAGAISLGIARALKIADTSLEHILRSEKLLTRDPRMKERKKYGLHGARKGTQFSKR